MANIYRIYPTLWEGQGCMDSQTVYAIDRQASQIPTLCSSRPKADPASTWDSPTFQRLTLPGSFQFITWSTLPAWISYVRTLGYSLLDSATLNGLKPFSDFYISGP